MRIAVILLLTVCCLRVAAEPRLVNGVAVIVNDAVITYKDIEREVLRELPMLRDLFGNQPRVFQERLRELETEYLKRLVHRALILQEYERAGYKVPESYIENKINEDIRGFGDQATLTKTLQAEGITREAYRKRVRENIILELMWQHHVPPDPVISPHRMEQYYLENQEQFEEEDQVRLRMMAFPNGASGVSGRRMAEEAAEKVREGVPFEEMARVYSPGSQPSGAGRPVWYARSELMEDLAAEAFDLEPGEMSEVIETPEASFIILVEEFRAERTKPISEVRQEIEAALKDRERNRLRQQWVERLERQAFIKYY